MIETFGDTGGFIPSYNIVGGDIYPDQLLLNQLFKMFNA